MTSGWPELPRSELAPAHLGLLEHTSGNFYVVCRGVQFGGQHDSAEAFYIDPNGEPVFLERPPTRPRHLPASHRPQSGLRDRTRDRDVHAGLDRRAVGRR